MRSGGWYGLLSLLLLSVKMLANFRNGIAGSAIATIATVVERPLSSTTV